MRRLFVALLCPMAFCAHAQDSPAEDEADATAGDLGTVRVIGVRPEPTDPFAFDNPIDFSDTRFQRAWRETPSAEEIGMQGGIVHIALNYGLMKVGQQVTRLPGWKHQVQPATARPPPLDEEQMQRAMRVMEAQDR